jgi:hypothetical protein
VKPWNHPETRAKTQAKAQAAAQAAEPVVVSDTATNGAAHDTSVAEPGMPADMEPTIPTASPAVEFLEQLHPGGPWVLTAIIPDGATETITAQDAKAIDAFVTRHNGKRNLYYSVNPTDVAVEQSGEDRHLGHRIFACRS